MQPRRPPRSAAARVAGRGPREGFFVLGLPGDKK